MSEHNGVVVTLPEIYKKVTDLETKQDRVIIAVEQMVAVNQRIDQHADRLRRVESQVAAQWVVVGIVITVIGAALVRLFSA